MCDNCCRLSSAEVSKDEDEDGFSARSDQPCWYLRLWRTSSGSALVGILAEDASMKEESAEGVGKAATSDEVVIVTEDHQMSCKNHSRVSSDSFNTGVNVSKRVARS